MLEAALPVTAPLSVVWVRRTEVDFCSSYSPPPSKQNDHIACKIAQERIFFSNLIFSIFRVCHHPVTSRYLIKLYEILNRYRQKGGGKQMPYPHTYTHSLRKQFPIFNYELLLN